MFGMKDFLLHQTDFSRAMGSIWVFLGDININKLSKESSPMNMTGTIQTTEDLHSTLSSGKGEPAFSGWPTTATCFDAKCQHCGFSGLQTGTGPLVWGPLVLD